ncbi:MAG: adenylyl-sulfate kinase [Crocinitomicaceae bacterium]|nr:adenylyl-sulfate kinase [Crocinitomicaceae bacterium]
MSENIYLQDFKVNLATRQRLNGHKPLVVWFTGLSGSGKSTVANELEKVLFENKVHTYTLDGDNIRLGINKGLSFSPEDRKENLRRVGEIAKLMVDAGLVCIAAFVSPLNADREALKEIIGREYFMEVFVDTPIAVCEERDVKGLYAKARRGEIKDFTGVNAPFESPENPDITLDTSIESLKESVEKVIELVNKKIKL